MSEVYVVLKHEPIGFTGKEKADIVTLAGSMEEVRQKRIDLIKADPSIDLSVQLWQNGEFAECWR